MNINSSATNFNIPESNGLLGNSRFLAAVQGNDKILMVFVVVFSLICFLPGFFSVPPLDRDESRFAQASKQMLQSGNYIDIRFQDQPRHKKPVGIYWLQVAATKLTGLDSMAPIWVYRIPSLLGAIAAVLASFWCARAFTGPFLAFLSSILIASTILLGVEARIAKTDAVLLACIVFAQGAIARIWLRETTKRSIGVALIFWTAFSASVLIKGPVGPMVLALTILSLCLIVRRIRWIRGFMPVAGLLYSLIIILPWFIAITIVTDGGFFYESIMKDLLGKVGQGQESHGAPPLTHLAAMNATFWPLSVFFILAVPAIVQNRKKPEIMFLLAWIIPTWVVFELVATKLPHYTLPILPAVAMATVIGLISWNNSWRIGKWIAAILLVLIPFGLTIATVEIPIFLSDGISPMGVILCVIGLLIALISTLQILKKEKPLIAILPAALASLFVYAGIWGQVLPAFSSVWISPRLSEKISDVTSCQNPSIRVAGYSEPSFVFLTNTETKFQPAEQIAAWFAESGCKVAVIEEKKVSRFKEILRSTGSTIESRGTVTGINYNNVDTKLKLQIFQSEYGQ